MRSYRMPQIAGTIVLASLAIIFATGVVKSYSSYIEYLHNDVDRAQLTHDAIALERQGRMGFWLTPEAIERWVHEESSGEAGHSLDDVYVIATQMVTDPRFQRT